MAKQPRSLPPEPLEIGVAITLYFPVLALERWTRITGNPRYKFQQWKRTQRWTGKKSTQGKDWSMDIGTTLSLLPNQYPAKFSFSTTTASCNDFVVYPTGVAPTAATVIAFDNMYGRPHLPLDRRPTGPTTRVELTSCRLSSPAMAPRLRISKPTPA